MAEDRVMKGHIVRLLKQGIRLDGRKAEEFRTNLKVEYGVAKLAEGSARVTIGETVVVAGVKMNTMTPYSDRPNEGTIMIGAELLPLSNPEFELGPPSIQAIELGRVIDRGIRESDIIDFKKLCITPGEKAWCISIDICPINDSGNLFDAGALAAIAALEDTRLPKCENGVCDYKTRTDEKLPLKSHKTISCTILKIGEVLVVDPLIEEEKALDARLTIAVREDGSLAALQKGGEEPLTLDEIEKIVDLGCKKAEELRKAL